MRNGGDYSGNSGEEQAKLRTLKAGSPEAWRELFSCHGPRLLAYAARMLGDQGAAEEVLQDSLVNIYKNIDQFDGRCSIKSWLYRAVHNSAIDEIRRRKRYVDARQDALENYFNEAGRWRQDCPGWDGLAAKQLDERRLLRVVEQEINHLPHTHREVLLLKEVEGLDAQEICDSLNIAPGNFRIRIHRARVALRAAVVRVMGEG